MEHGAPSLSTVQDEQAGIAAETLPGGRFVVAPLVLVNRRIVAETLLQPR
jgi:hypothetical protein